MRDLLARFVDALDHEIAEVERDSRSQTFELVSGRRDQAATGLLYIFLLSDVLRLPDDASGSLELPSGRHQAFVVAVEGNRIWIHVETISELPDFIPVARLVLNQTDLLKRLKERIVELSASSELGLAPKVFGRQESTANAVALPSQIETCISSDSTRMALRQAFGSELTYLWGPPGTGKTFSIAALVAAFTFIGETVLVTSHTHSAVEQALWAAVEPPTDVRPPGMLHDHELVRSGRILKVGVPRPASKLPRDVQLNNYLEDRAREREESAAALVIELRSVEEQVVALEESIRPWLLLRELNEAHSRLSADLSAAETELEAADRFATRADQEFAVATRALDRASRSFILGRPGRVARARQALSVAQSERTKRQAAAGLARARVLSARDAVAQSDLRVAAQREVTDQLEAMDAIQGRLAPLHASREQLQTEIRALRDVGDDDANTLLERSAAVFATLTKLYTDRTKLSQMSWDNVILDEASMAMPPLVAFAAARARKRIIVAGDMYQLPPIVQSDEETAGGLLGKDVFELSGVLDAVETGREHPNLARLTTQRRMHPLIAGAARELITAYHGLSDDSSVVTRTRARWLDALSPAPLLTVDISAFHPWSGKLPVSLSRFNVVSAHASVELAAILASRLREPDPDAEAPIGIVTPYSAQRRYITRLIGALGLSSWVTAGTVHTFQGNECDAIIFDTVLGEPHWTARLTDPTQFDEVKRDLNVAVTRARHQFVLVGDASWLRKHAKPDSGYGKLWNYTTSIAEPQDAAAILGREFLERVAQGNKELGSWTADAPAGAQLLNETEFYPRFIEDLASATSRVVLYTPFIGKIRWPQIEPHIAALRSRDVSVYILHKPLSDREWRQWDSGFGKRVFDSLSSMGVHLVPLSGVHAKTIVIDGEVIFDGSLNWASQTSSYEHMWRIRSKPMAALVERMLQLDSIVEAFGSPDANSHSCPRCGGPLMVVNQTQQATFDPYPVKLACLAHSEDKSLCQGYLRRVDARAPYLTPPKCSQGSKMKVKLTKNGRPWSWICSHSSCRPIRWANGDCLK